MQKRLLGRDTNIVPPKSRDNRKDQWRRSGDRGSVRHYLSFCQCENNKWRWWRWFRSVDARPSRARRGRRTHSATTWRRESLRGSLSFKPGEETLRLMAGPRAGQQKRTPLLEIRLGAPIREAYQNKYTWFFCGWKVSDQNMAYFWSDTFETAMISPSDFFFFSFVDNTRDH